MSLPNIDSVYEAANRDPEFLIAARFWNTLLKLEMGENSFILTIRDGKIASVDSTPSPSEPWEIRIGGPLEDWNEIVSPVPRPFYQDIFAATVYHNLSYEGDLELMFAYYPALRRFVEIMRECAAGAREEAAS